RPGGRVGRNVPQFKTGDETFGGRASQSMRLCLHPQPQNECRRDERQARQPRRLRNYPNHCHQERNEEGKKFQWLFGSPSLDEVASLSKSIDVPMESGISFSETDRPPLDTALGTDTASITPNAKAGPSLPKSRPLIRCFGESV